MKWPAMSPEQSRRVEWDTIKSIKYLGQEHVYDLEIKDTHNFLGNDILAHNTFISGNTGIGFTTPDRRLLISSDINIVGSNASLLGSGGTQVSISGDSGTGTQKKLVLGIDTTDNFAVIQAGTLGTNYALALSPAGGNVGIGTTTTNATLSVVGNASIGGLYTGVSPPANSLFVHGNVGIGATDSNNRLDVWGNSRLAGNLVIDGTCTGCGGGTSGWTDDGTVVRLTTISDNVGIGTTSPSQRLQVNFSSSNPFVVTSGGNVGIGFTTPTSLLHIQGDGSTGTWRTNANYLPGARDFPSPVVANGYVYVIGGSSNSGTTVHSTVFYAKLNSDGGTGTWTTNINYLPGVRWLPSTVIANGYLYVIGGRVSGSSQSTVLYAKLNSDGSTGTWATNANYLPGVRDLHSSVVANGYLYVIAGSINGGTFQSTVFYAKLSADGSIGSWTTNANYLPATRQGHSSVVANGYVYVIGGSGASTIYYAKLNSDGSIGAWSTNTNSLPLARQYHSSVIANGYIYVIGGQDDGGPAGRQSTVYYARLNSDGSLGTWSTNANYLPVIRSFIQSSVVINGYVYVMGGVDASASQSTIYYAPLQKVSIAGDLDLLGLTGGNVGDSTGDSSFGSVGGSVFAGNIFSAGALEVSGNTQLWSGLGINGPVSIGVGATNPPQTLVSIQQGTLNLGTGTTPPSSLLSVAADGSTGTFSTNSNSLPAIRSLHSSVVANGYLYVVGGFDTIERSTIYYARLNSDGSLGTFSTNSNSLPAIRRDHSSVVANGYLYVVGGFDDTAARSTIYYARINSDGSLGTFSTNSNSLPAIKREHSSVVANGYLYVVGGLDATASSTIYYARINSDGSLGTFSTNSNSLPAIRRFHSSVVANGYLYVVGGFDDTASRSTIYYARINSDGSLGTFSLNSNSLPAVRRDHSSVVANGYLYVVGGFDSAARSTIYYARLNSDGSLGTFSTNSNSLPAVRRDHSSVMANGYLYVVGGSDATAARSTIYYAPLARVSIAADLDLLGITGGNVGDSTGDSSQGSVGGSVFAGNIFSAGALEVSGNSQFWSGAGFNGPVNIGIGASSPATGAAFSISGNTSLTGPQIPVFNVLNNGNVGIGVSAPGALLHIASNATCFDGTNASTACSLNDYAEVYPASSPTEKGDVVSIDTSKVGSLVPSGVEGDSFEVKGWVKPSTTAYDKKIIGIVTSAPAILIEGGAIKLMGTSYQHDPYKPGVALAGRVPVKVSTENGPIEVGDFLTSSSTPGYAMKATKAGPTVGKALEGYSGQGTGDSNTDTVTCNLKPETCPQGKILAFINVSFADPNDFFASLTLDESGNLIIPKIKTGSLTLDSSIASASATLSTNYPLPTTNYYYDLSGKIASLEERITELENDIAGESTPSASLAEQTPEVNIETSGVSAPDILIATDSAILANLTVKSSATMSGVLTAYQAQIQDHFKVLGQTTLSSTQIAGDLNIDGTLSIENGSEINVIGSPGILYLQKSPLAQGLDILNGKVTVDRDGNLKASTITADQYKLNQGKSLGSGQILAGQTESLIENPYVQEGSIIFVNPKDQTAQSLAVSQKQPGAFLVKLITPQPADINFEYLIVGVKR